MRKLLASTSIVVVLACSALAQNGPVTRCTLTVEGAKQGVFKGDAGQKPNPISCLHST
jgi:tRNA (Thr-GGU) A37 N-methylase